MNEFPEITQTKVVAVRPGDVIWLKTGNITRVRADEVRATAKLLWPDNEVVVAQKIDVEIVRPT